MTLELLGFLDTRILLSETDFAGDFLGLWYLLEALHMRQIMLFGFGQGGDSSIEHDFQWFIR